MKIHRLLFLVLFLLPLFGHGQTIPALGALGAAPATGDLLYVVDVSDTADSVSGTGKKMTVANLFTAPSLTTPALGAATATSVNVGTGTTITKIKHGTATLVAGTVTVSETATTANSRILLTSQSDGGTPGWLRISARSASTSFTITSSSGSDTSTVAWVLIEP